MAQHRARFKHCKMVGRFARWGLLVIAFAVALALLARSGQNSFPPRLYIAIIIVAGAAALVAILLFLSSLGHWSRYHFHQTAVDTASTK